MYKKILGVIFLLFLCGLMIFNFYEKSNKQSSIVQEHIDGFSDGSSTSAHIEGIEEGEVAPDFKLESLEGDTIQLSDLQGKKVMINFWATWCGPCRKEMPAMQKFYDEFSDDIEILAINATNSEKNIETVQSFIDEFDFTYPTLLDKDNSVNDAYRIVGLPTTYFVGTDGVVHAPKKVGPMTYDFMVGIMEYLK